MYGVLIEQAPQNWQIIQQKDGFGTIKASGRYVIRPDMGGKEPQVFLRIVREENGMEVCGWQQADMLESSRWEISLQVPAGGLYRLESGLTCGGMDLNWACRGDMRHHLGVGDLYVITGQSNSAGYGKDPVYDPPEMGVHILRNSMRWDLASHPLNESTDIVHTENMEPPNPGSCPYLSFAKTLKRELGYPIGLLQTCLGGTPLSAWNPAENGYLYREMMEVIQSQGGNIKGFLWYQGCSDCDSQKCYSTYLDRFRNMVEQSRKDLGAEIPWITVQLSRCIGDRGPRGDMGWGTVREAQRQAARQISGISVVPATDCGMSDTIHVSAASHVILGERMAASALRDIYGRQYGCGAPDLEKAVLQSPDVIELQFSNVSRNLFKYGPVRGNLEGFTVWDENGTEIPVLRARCAENRIWLELAHPAGCGCTVAGGWEMNPPVLMPVDNGTHLPILSFCNVPVEMNL